MREAEQEKHMLGKPLSNTAITRNLNIAPESARGKPAKVQPGSMTGTSSDDTKCTVEVAPDGLSAKLHPVAGQLSEVVTDADGNTTPTPLDFTFEGDADLGSGVRSVSVVYSCALVEEEATGLVVTEGADEF